ncbi:hypothetical protein FIM1_2082 [Kluyveromyces marxianus]|uniref:Uncharacterized protein n=1 Tax=Kluyveromyces marxianus TaxID=4911 RepID=A0ABX6ETM3_KLUMA|nr:hypothetical protein FIM1_2082 [Kluyveromyces marxianus]
MGRRWRSGVCFLCFWDACHLCCGRRKCFAGASVGFLANAAVLCAAVYEAEQQACGLSGLRAAAARGFCEIWCLCVCLCVFFFFFFFFFGFSFIHGHRSNRAHLPESKKPFPPLPHPRLAGSLFNIFVCLLFMRLLYTETHYVKISRRRRKSSTILYLYYTKLN